MRPSAIASGDRRPSAAIVHRAAHALVAAARQSHAHALDTAIVSAQRRQDAHRRADVDAGPGRRFEQLGVEVPACPRATDEAVTIRAADADPCHASHDHAVERQALRLDRPCQPRRIAAAPRRPG